MGKRLSEDQIRWILSLDASEAEKGTAALTKKNIELTNRNKDLKKSMQQLEAQGKTNTENFRKLSEEYHRNANALSSNREMMKSLERQMGVTNLSMTQLKRRAQDLQRQLDNTSQALHPEEWNKLNNQLVETKDRMSELKNSGKEIESQFGKVITSSGTWATLFGNMLTKATEWGGQLLVKMKDIALEGVSMAEAADGVTRAFRRMDDGTMLENLRKATKGTVTDLELMKAAVKAKDFRIPLDDLGKYLQFAQLKAQQTGQSVEYMTDSIVTGLGRQSVLILDNLGLSAAEINEQVSRTGDFMSAVASIVDKQLVEAGGNYVSAADRATQKTVEFQNAQRELGEILLPLKQQWDDTYGTFQVTTMQFIGWIVKHKDGLVVLTTAVMAYITAQKMQKLWTERNTTATAKEILIEKGKAAWLATTRGATLLYAAAKARLAGDTAKATKAMKLFSMATRMNPIGLLVAGVAAAATAMLLLKGNSEKADKSISDLNIRLATERTELNNIFNELKKTNPGTSERTRIVKELNGKYSDLIGNYNLETASLKEITRAQNEANTALTNRIATEMKAQSISDYVKNNVSSQIKAEERLLKLMRSSMDPQIFNKLKPAMTAFLQDSTKDLKTFTDQFGDYADMSLGNQVEFTAFYRALRADQKSLSSGVDEINKKYEPYIKSIKAVTTLSDEELKQQMKATSKIKQLEKERQHVQDTWKEDTKKNIGIKNQELERLDNKIKKYKELGTVKAKTDAANKAKTAADKAKALAEKEKKAVLHTEKEAMKSLEQLREEDLQEQQKWYNTAVFAFNTDLSEKLITQEQHDLLMIELEKTNAENRLKIEQSYYEDAQSLEVTNGELKEEQVRKAGQRVLDAEKSANAARAAEQQKLNDLIKDFKSQFKVTTVDEDYEAQKAVLEASYQARKEMVERQIKENKISEEEGNRVLLDLKSAHDRASEQLEREHQQHIQSIREQYGLTTQKERFDAELAQLKSFHEQGYLQEEEYQKAIQDLKRDSLKKQFDYYSNLFSGAIQALQQAEMDNVDAKYNAEIEAAQGNSEEVGRLEKEKAQKKLDIEKKYADVKFAIKASQIAADTAMAIIETHASLGGWTPWAIAAAALMGITGAAQLASANAERQKVKNMTLSGGSSGSKGGTRVATGRQEGGKIDVRRAQDGKLFPNADYDPDERGFIDRPTVIVGEGPIGHSREWVASNAAVENPTVAPILNLLDQAQQAGTIRTLDLNQVIRARMAGFSSGGAVSKPLPVQPDVTSPDAGATLPPELMLRLAKAIISIDENGVPASVSLTELDRKQQLRNRSRSIGSK